MEDNYCEYRHECCEYLIVCKDFEGVCAKDLLGKELILQPEYSPEAILERIKFFKDKPILQLPNV